MNHWLEKVATFDYDMLNNPEFKEDSVREEIIMPLIKGKRSITECLKIYLSI